MNCIFPQNSLNFSLKTVFPKDTPAFIICSVSQKILLITISVPVEEARQTLNQDSSLYHTVIKAFGIRGRNLVPPEMNFLKQWSTKFGFPEELIAEACSRTIRAIHEPNFGYANSILEKWHKAGIHTMDAVAKADEVYQQQKSRPERSQQPATASQFTNFKQRNNNYQDLQQQLLQKSMSATENKPQS